MVTIELQDDEALVLFDWLCRRGEEPVAGSIDPAEQRVLWDIEAVLEKRLTAPLRPDYAEMVARARAAVRDRAG